MKKITMWGVMHRESRLDNWELLRVLYSTQGDARYAARAIMQARSVILGEPGRRAKCVKLEIRVVGR